MSSIHLDHDREFPSHAVAPQIACRLARQIAQTLCRWLDRIDQRMALEELDEHLLQDIGKTRLEVEAEAKKPFWRE
jgi:uncharacterized protein YjiS (DUF1127 family)